MTEYPPFDTALGRWVVSQRQVYKKSKVGLLSAEQIAALKSLPNWTWDAWDSHVDGRIEELRDFVAEHGRLPKQRDNERSLAGWVGTQKRQYAQGSLDEQRIAQLTAIAPEIWDSPLKPAAQRWDELEDWSRTHGHRPSARATDPEEATLGAFLSQVRKKKLFPTELAAYDDKYPLRRAPIEQSIPKIEAFVQQHGMTPSHRSNDPAEYKLGMALLSIQKSGRHKEWFASLPRRHRPPTTVNTSAWWDCVYEQGNVRPHTNVDSYWYKKCLQARVLYRDNQMSQAEQTRCERDFPEIWDWLRDGDPTNSTEWWNKRIYYQGDKRPTFKDVNWYAHCSRARFLNRDGKMTSDEQARCRSGFPKIWEWLNA